MLYNTTSGNLMMLANSPLLKIGKGAEAAANAIDEEESLSNNMLR